METRKTPPNSAEEKLSLADLIPRIRQKINEKEQQMNRRLMGSNPSLRSKKRTC
jgi:hypothetical protein